MYASLCRLYFSIRYIQIYIYIYMMRTIPLRNMLNIHVMCNFDSQPYANTAPSLCYSPAEQVHFTRENCRVMFESAAAQPADSRQAAGWDTCR